MDKGFSFRDAIVGIGLFLLADELGLIHMIQIILTGGK